MIELHSSWKLLSIQMDTWPQLYKMKDLNSKVRKNGSINVNTTTAREGMV